MKSSTRNGVGRSGMATVMAIVVIGLLASVLTATATRAVIEQRRAAIASGEALASRLLAAAAQIARQQVADAQAADGPVAAPLGRVTFAWRGATDARLCDVTVDAGNVRQIVTLRFNNHQLVAAE